MPKLRHKPPSYSLHKASGQAVVKVNGRCHYLGKYRSAKSRQAYRELLSKWAAVNHANAAGLLSQMPPLDDLRICELLAAYLEFADGYYRKNGQPTKEVDRLF